MGWGLVGNFEIQEVREGLKELAGIDYKDEDYKSVVSENNSDVGFVTGDVGNAEEEDGLLERNGWFPYLKNNCLIFFFPFLHDTITADGPTIF